MEAISAERPEEDKLRQQVRTLMNKIGKTLKDRETDELESKGMVMVRAKLNLMKVGVILQQVGELYGVVVETPRGYWVPTWFFMAVWPAAKRGDRDKAEERAYRAVFDGKYQQAMETQYALSRKIEIDNQQTGMWE